MSHTEQSAQPTILSNALVEETWNQARSQEQLQGFIENRLQLLGDHTEFEGI